MTVPILQYPDPRLREVCKHVRMDDAPTRRTIAQLVVQLAETMHSMRGFGLSAPQIGSAVRVFVVHVPGETSSPLAFINPRVEEVSKEVVTLNEGCLSFELGTMRNLIERPERVTVTRWVESGAADTHEFKGWTARAVLHEIDHLDGRLLIDRMSPIAQKSIERQFARQLKKSQGAMQ